MSLPIAQPSCPQTMPFAAARLVNLFSNAIDAMEETGKLIAGAGKIEVEPEAQAISGYLRNSFSWGCAIGIT
jgi:hypothetical protein